MALEINNSRDRFEKAKIRYTQLASGDNSSVNESNEELLSMISSKLGKNITRPNNDNKLPFPIPLPVENINLSERLAMELQPVKTLPEKIAESFKNLKAEFIKILSRPLRIDKSSNIANESTLKEAITSLNMIHTNISNLAKTIANDNELTRLERGITRSFNGIIEESEKERGWVTKLVDRMRGVPKLNKSITGVQDLLLPISLYSRKTTDYLKKSQDYFKEQTKYLKQLLDNSNDQQESQTEQVREDMEERKKPSPFTGLLEALFPDSKMLRKAMMGITSIGNFFKNIGEFTEKQLQGNKGLSQFLGVGMLASAIGPILGLFGGIAAFVTSVVGAAAFASVYSFFKNPDQLARMLGAIGTLFTEVIQPALVWITKEILPPLSLAFAGLMVVADKLLETVGTVINEGLIYVIGTALPAVFKLLGTYIDEIWQGLKKIVFRIAGMFGVGPHAEEGILGNILGAFLDIGDSIMRIITVFADTLIKQFALQDFFGLKEGEGIWGRIKRFFSEDLPNMAMGLIDSLISKTQETITSLDPIQMIRDKLSSFINVITSIIPSWDDIKGWMLNAIPDWVPQSLKGWFEDRLASDTELPRISTASTTARQKEIDPNIHDQMNPYSRGFNPSIIVAPTNNNTTNNSVSNTTRGGTPFIGNTNPPPSHLDGLLFMGTP